MTIEVRPVIIVSRAWFTNRSLSASSADVASSNNSTCGFTSTARAIAIRCFCPPESLIPRSPTHVSRPLSRVRTNSATFARDMASQISSSVAPGAPNLQLSLIDLAKRTGSCDTTPMSLCRCLCSIFETSTPATATTPESGS
mmetsp:Transcript_11869/g.44166  ORF Transcript_11869/g.44166 Transcript_11869/m.44166 type:complete len:142 (+) Transcript_11869:5681-6106(+)